MEPKFFQLPVCVGDVTLRVAKGHFATSHSHINYFMDVTRQKASLGEATAVAQQLAERYLSAMKIDTILCLDGTRVIGACLARQLTQGETATVNRGQDICILRDERDESGCVRFRENNRHMVEGKTVLLLMASVTTGKTALTAMESVRRTGGEVVGIVALYSSLRELGGMEIAALFDLSDLPDYASYDPKHCPLCEKKVPLDATVNSFGYASCEKMAGD